METVCIGLGDRRRRASRTLGLLVPLILVRSFVTTHHARPDQTQTSLAGPVGDGDWIRIHPRSSLLHKTGPVGPKNRFLALISLMSRSGELSFLSFFIFVLFPRSVSCVHLRAWWLGLTPSESLAPWFRNISSRVYFWGAIKVPRGLPGL
ncbi:uncharacterized protein BDV14DRAFT_164261 [Aspergillus stella-maris]|uniref:uncharacterized protein n=1 Tax=Aspergillus stella-maris TaxID=1810926 RepID=UPI003CCD49C5